jgi:hypothetical protein
MTGSFINFGFLDSGLYDYPEIIQLNDIFIGKGREIYEKSNLFEL